MTNSRPSFTTCVPCSTVQTNPVHKIGSLKPHSFLSTVIHSHCYCLDQATNISHPIITVCHHLLTVPSVSSLVPSKWFFSPTMANGLFPKFSSNPCWLLAAHGMKSIVFRMAANAFCDLASACLSNTISYQLYIIPYRPAIFYSSLKVSFFWAFAHTIPLLEMPFPFFFCLTPPQSSGSSQHYLLQETSPDFSV